MIRLLSRQCTATCFPSFQYSSGETEMTVICQNGQWLPEYGNEIQDCESVCNPPCENGGKCIGNNQCQCGENFRGTPCEHGMHLKLCLIFK